MLSARCASQFVGDARRADAAAVLGIRNMIELCFDLNQPEAIAKAAVTRKYPDTEADFINSIISEIYGS